MKCRKIKPGYYWVLFSDKSKGIYERVGDKWCRVGDDEQLFEDNEAKSYMQIPDPETCRRLAIEGDDLK